MAKSAAGLIVVTTAGETFARTGSKTGDETVAVLVTVPTAFGVTVIVTEATELFASVPTLQLTVFPLGVTVPWLGVALANVTPEGNGSLNATFVAVEGPRLVTVRL